MLMTNDENSKLLKQTNASRRQRQRSVFDLEQIRQLENVFDCITHYPDLSIRQHLSNLTQLPDKKIQIWFQNRRAKWRKQHRLVYFGGLHELAMDEHVAFVPTPKPNFVQASSSIAMPNTSMILQLEQFFYWVFQTTVVKSKDCEHRLFTKRHDTTLSPAFIKHSATAAEHHED